MSNPSTKLKTDVECIACLDLDDQQQRNKRKIAKQPAKNLLELNEDCVFAIFERADVMDLANVAQSCTYLKTIAFNIFQRKYNSLKLKFCKIVSEEEAVQAKLLFKTFGSLVVELDIQFIDVYNNENKRTADIVHAIVAHCSSIKTLKLASFDVPDDEFWFIRMRKLFARLETLHLHHFFYTYDYDYFDEQVITPNGNVINCFDNCTSLRELNIYESCVFYEAIFQNSFPKLQHFIINDPESCHSENMNAFILRHPHLKTFSLDCEHRHVHTASTNLQGLETFGFRFDYGTLPGSIGTTSVESLAKCRNLKELTCFAVGSKDDMSALLKILPKLANTLEVLDLQYGYANRNLIAAVNSLKKLKVVRLTDITFEDTSDDQLKDLIRATVIIE